jgi:hypothetical protein
VLLSAEPESGKTRVLEVLNTLVPKPMFNLSPSPATIFRTLAKYPITLLLDEIDTIFTRKGKEDNYEDLRGLLNVLLALDYEDWLPGPDRCEYLGQTVWHMPDAFNCPTPVACAVGSALPEILRLEPHDLVQERAALIGVVVGRDDLVLTVRFALGPQAASHQDVDKLALIASRVTANDDALIAVREGHTGVRVVVRNAAADPAGAGLQLVPTARAISSAFTASARGAPCCAHLRRT